MYPSLSCQIQVEEEGAQTHKHDLLATKTETEHYVLEGRVFATTHFSPGFPTTNSAIRPGVPTKILGFRFRICSKFLEKVVPPIANWTFKGVFSKSCRATLTI